MYISLILNPAGQHCEADGDLLTLIVSPYIIQRKGFKLTAEIEPSETIFIFLLKYVILYTFINSEEGLIFSDVNDQLKKFSSKVLTITHSSITAHTNCVFISC